MSTPISSSTSYCTPAIFLEYYDARQVGDLVGDAGTRVSSASLLTDTNVQNALNWASGEIEAACLVADKYSVADLQALTGMSLARLQGLCADLAIWKLMQRRLPQVQITEGYRAAQETLERLRLGERIFGLQEQADAGTPNTVIDTQSVIDTLNLSTTLSSRFWGNRAKEKKLG